MDTLTRKPISIERLERLSEEIHPLEVVFDQMRDHVVITDENANIVYANKAAQHHTGFKVHEMIGKNPGDLWGGKMPREFYRKLWYRIKVEKEPYIGEVENQRKDGGKYWQELRISPILDSAGEVKFFIAIEPNITDKIELAKSKENFANTFDKRLQNSILGLRQTLDWLSLNGKLTQKQKDRLEIAYRQQQNLALLVSDLLEFVQPFSGSST